MDRQGKESLRAVAAERLSKSKAVIVAEYRGLTVEELTKLRVELRKASAEFKIVKNRIAKKAISIEQQQFEGLSKSFKGPVIPVFGLSRKGCSNFLIQVSFSCCNRITSLFKSIIYSPWAA